MIVFQCPTCGQHTEQGVRINTDKPADKAEYMRRYRAKYPAKYRERMKRDWQLRKGRSKA